MQHPAEEQHQITYPELLNFFYDCNFPCHLRGNAVAIAHAIMQKWNRLIRPSQFEMSNKELSYMSGVELNIGRSRQQLLGIAKIDGIPLFTYISKGQRKARIYKINITLISDKYQNNITLVSLSAHNEKDPKERKKERTTAPKGPLTRSKSKEVAVVCGQTFRWIEKREMEKLIAGFGEEAVFERAVVIDRVNSARSKSGYLIDALEKDYIPTLPPEEIATTDRKKRIAQNLVDKKAELERVTSLDATLSNFSKKYPSGREMTPLEARADSIDFLEEQIRELESHLGREL